MRREDDEPAAGAVPAAVDATADAVARRSYGKLVAFLASRLRDVAAAEDALSDAFAAALDAWPRGGVPENPEAWLLIVARRILEGVIDGDPIVKEEVVRIGREYSDCRARALGHEPLPRLAEPTGRGVPF